MAGGLRKLYDKELHNDQLFV